MAVSEEYLAYVIEQLAPFARVTSRRMFGGVGLYADGLFFGLIGDGALYFKVDDTNRADYERLGSKPFVPFPDEPHFSMSYYNVPADLLDDSDELSRWARKSLAVALSAAARKMKAKSKAKTKKRSTRKGSTQTGSAKKRSKVVRKESALRTTAKRKAK